MAAIKVVVHECSIPNFYGFRHFEVEVDSMLGHVEPVKPGGADVKRTNLRIWEKYDPNGLCNCVHKFYYHYHDTPSTSK
ncbi:hypothetical protein AHAS_Ahas16G0171200 [Arachis hypogaea]